MVLGWLDNITGECLKQALGLILAVLSAAAGVAAWLINKERSRADKAEAKLEQFMLKQQERMQQELERLRAAPKE